VNDPERDLDHRLSRLGRATEGIRPREGLSSRIMARVIDEPRPRPWFAVFEGFRRLLPVFAVLAGLGISFAFVSENAVDDVIALSDQQAEIDW
jgi:hypothetical protein